MKLGDLVKIVNGGETLSLWLGEAGVIVRILSRHNDKQEHWYDVLIDGKVKMINGNYLEVA